MNRMFKKRTPRNDVQDSISPEIRKLLQDASLQTLKKVYAKCSEEKVPYGALIDAIEKEIYLKTIKTENWKIDRIYRLQKFVPKKKEARHEQQPRT